MEKRLRYLREEQPGAAFYAAPCAVRGWRPGQRADGYGRKISTDYVVRYGGRTRRVYVCQFSNAGTAYVIDRGEWLLVGDFHIPENPPALPPEYRAGIVTR